MKFFRLHVENGKKMNFLIFRRKRQSFDQFFAVGQVCFHDRKYTSAKFQGEKRTFHTIDVMLLSLLAASPCIPPGTRNMRHAPRCAAVCRKPHATCQAVPGTTACRHRAVDDPGWSWRMEKLLYPVVLYGAHERAFGLHGSPSAHSSTHTALDPLLSPLYHARHAA